MNAEKLLITLLVYVFISNVFVNSEKHRECGETPTQKYKDLARTIG